MEPDQTGGTVTPILALGNHSSPFLIPNESDTFTVGRLHQKQKKKEKKGGGTEKQLCFKLKKSYTGSTTSLLHSGTTSCTIATC